MSKDGIDGAPELIEKQRELLIESAFQQLRMLFEAKERLRGLQPAWLAAATAPPSASAKARANELFYDVARLALANQEQWLKLGSRFFDSILESVPTRCEPTPPASAPRLALRATGCAGGVASLRFVVENPRRESAEVLVTSLVLRSAETSSTACPSASLKRVDATAKDGAKLAAGASGRFELTLDLTGIEPGSYRGGALVIAGGQVMGEIDVNLDVTQGAVDTKKIVTLSRDSENTLSLSVVNPLDGSATIQCLSEAFRAEGRTLYVKTGLYRQGDGRAAIGRPVVLQARETAQLCLQVEILSGDTSPGDYEGFVVLLAGAVVVQRVALTVQVTP